MYEFAIINNLFEQANNKPISDIQNVMRPRNQVIGYEKKLQGEPD